MLMKHLAEQISRREVARAAGYKEIKAGRSCWGRYLGPGLAAAGVRVAQEEPSSLQVFYLQVRVHSVCVFCCVWDVKVRR